MSDFETAKAFLQTKQGGVSIYEHLTEVLLKLITEQPKDAVTQFERISAAVKSSSVYDHSPATGASAAAAAVGAGEPSEESTVRDAAIARVAAASAVFKRPGEDEEVGEAEGVQDVADAANYLEWAGVGLGKEEMFRLGLSLRKLGSSSQARSLRLWGKIQGLNGDYIIAEGRVDAGDDESEEARDALGNVIEPTGTGVNTTTYWVCEFAGADWKRLPRVTPHQLIVARQIKRFFTGDLEAAVGGHPPFPGNEAAFLRAQIARISADAVLVPAGHLKRTEDEESRDVEPVPDEEYGGDDLSANDGWVHLMLPINAIGRTAPNPKEGDAEEGGGDDEGLLTQPLKPIAEDSPLTPEDEGPPFAIRACPGTGIPLPEPGKGVCVVKSLRWPGAVSVGVGRRFANFYAGFAVEAAPRTGPGKAPATFQPSVPGAVSAEFSMEAFNPGAAESGARFQEQPDIVVDPDAGKPAPADDAADADE
jgi:radial spoke head protein 4/6